jgi:hypothetical protein
LEQYSERFNWLKENRKQAFFPKNKTKFNQIFSAQVIAFWGERDFPSGFFSLPSLKNANKKIFFLQEKRIDKTIELSEYIKNLLLENTTISFMHLTDVQ